MAVNLGSVVNRQNPLNRGRVAWYLSLPGQDKGNTWIDIVSKVNGTLTNGPTWGSRGIQFDGTDDYVTLGTGTIFFGKINGAVASLSMWFNPTGSLTAYQALFDCGFSSIDRMFSVFLGGNANEMFVGIGHTGGSPITLTTATVTNQWQHLLITCDGTTARIYRNGVLNGSGTSSVSSTFASSEARIGGNPSGGGAAYQGYIDDVSIWDRCLSADEARAIYYQSLMGYPLLLTKTRVGFTTTTTAATPIATPSLVHSQAVNRAAFY